MENLGTIIETSNLPSGGEVEKEIQNTGNIMDLLFFVNSTNEQVELLILKSDGTNWLSNWQSIGFIGTIGIGTGGFNEQMWGGFLGEKIKVKLRNPNANNTNVVVTLQMK